jgi:hypothetical protein
LPFSCPFAVEQRYDDTVGQQECANLVREPGERSRWWSFRLAGDAHNAAARLRERIERGALGIWTFQSES